MITPEGGNLVFLMSLPRSGSTLLSLILDGHPEISCPPEPWFLLRLAGLGGPGRAENIFDDEFARIGTSEFLAGNASRDASRAFAATAYNHNLAATNKTILVDKTPRYFHILPYLDDTFPEAKRIWLKRDPLDVAASYKRSWGIPAAVLAGDTAAPPAFDFTVGLFNLIAMGPSALEVKYEDLVREPERAVHQVCEHIGVQYSEEMLVFSNETLARHRSKSLGDTKALDTSTPHTSSVGRWETILTSDEVGRIVNLLGARIFRQLGYDATLARVRELGVEIPEDSDTAARDRLIQQDADKIGELRHHLDATRGECHELRNRLHAARDGNDALREELQKLRTDLARAHSEGFAGLLTSNTRPERQTILQREHQQGLVSVVIPAYNAAPFIERAVRSVWTQTYPDVEILVCDDGSMDDTLNILGTLAARSPIPMRVLRHPAARNRGVSETRNVCIRASRGEFIALLDADDAFLPGKLNRQVAFFSGRQDVNAVCSYGYNRDPSGKLVQGWNGNTVAGDYRDAPPPHDFKPPYDFQQLLVGDPIVNSTVVIRRGALLEAGIYPVVMAHQAEDWLLFAKLSLVSPIELLTEQLIDYTVHSDSYTTRYFADNLGYGVQLEFLYYLTHWMIRHPGHRHHGELVFRRFYPKLLAASAPMLQMLEELAKRMGEPSVEALEHSLSLTHREIEDLRAYHARTEGYLRPIRELPGVRAVVRMAKRLARRR